MNKLSLILLLGIAQTSVAAPHCFKGFYVKGGLGGTRAQFEVNHDLLFEIPTVLSFDQTITRTYNAGSLAGMLGGGYAFQSDSLWVISAEFTASFANASISDTTEFDLTDIGLQMGSTTDATLKNDFALLLKPGLVTLGKTQFYALIGPRWGRFETSSEASVDYRSILTGSGSNSNSGYVVGLTVGVGVERFIADGFGVALEYSYTSYGNIPSPSNAFETNTVSGITGTAANDVDIQASANTLMVDIIYHFK